MTRVVGWPPKAGRVVPGDIAGVGASAIPLKRTAMVCAVNTTTGFAGFENARALCMREEGRVCAAADRADERSPACARSPSLDVCADPGRRLHCLGTPVPIANVVPAAGPDVLDGSWSVSYDQKSAANVHVGSMRAGRRGRRV